MQIKGVRVEKHVQRIQELLPQEEVTGDMAYGARDMLLPRGAWGEHGSSSSCMKVGELPL